jgi:hypothetical protein
MRRGFKCTIRSLKSCEKIQKPHRRDAEHAESPENNSLIKNEMKRLLCGLCDLCAAAVKFFYTF